MADTINNGKHKMMGDGENHRITNFTWADATARTSATYTEFDIYKEGVQIDTDPPTFWRIISVTSGVAEFIQIGGGGVAKTNYFGLKFLDSADGINFTLSDLSFFTAAGLKIPVTLEVDLGGNTVGNPLINASDGDTGTNFSVINGVDPVLFPLIVYASAPGFYAEDVAYIEVYQGYGEYGHLLNFQYVTSTDAITWYVNKTFKNVLSVDGETTRYNTQLVEVTNYAVKTDDWNSLYKSGDFCSAYDAANAPEGLTFGYLAGRNVYHEGNGTFPDLRHQFVAHLDTDGSIVNLYQRGLVGTNVSGWTVV